VVLGLKNPGLERETVEGVMHDAFLSISSWREEPPRVARDHHPIFRRFSKTACNNPDRWLIEPIRPLGVRRQIHTPTVTTRRKKGADDSHRDREDYVAWSCWFLFVSRKGDLSIEANPGRPSSWAGADGWSRSRCERGLQNDWRLFLGVVRRWCVWNFYPHARTGRPVSGGCDALHVCLIYNIEDSSDRHYPGPPVELGRNGGVASRGEETRESGVQR